MSDMIGWIRSLFRVGRPAVDEAEADFRAWSLVWDALKFNSSTLQSQVDTFDRKATTLIAGGGVLIGLSLALLSPKTSGNGAAVAFLILSGLLAIASEIVGAVGVMSPGLLEVPYIGSDQIAAHPGPRDEVARNLVSTMSKAIAKSQPTYKRKRQYFQWQLRLFIAASISFGVVVATVGISAWLNAGAITSCPIPTPSPSNSQSVAATASRPVTSPCTGTSARTSLVRSAHAVYFPNERLLQSRDLDPGSELFE